MSNEKIIIPPTVQTGDTEWTIVSSSADIPLTKNEIKTAKSKRIKVGKFAKVKKLILQGHSKNAIHRETGLSRVTIDKYLKLLSPDTKKAIQIVHGMYTKCTPNKKSVQCNVLLLLGFIQECTLLFKPLFFLALLIGGGVVLYKFVQYQERVAAYQLERSIIINDFYKVLGLRFMDTYFVTETASETAWIVKMNIQYGGGRIKYEELLRELNEDAWKYYHRKEAVIRKWNINHREELEAIRNQRDEWLEVMREHGYLDYFRGYNNGQFAASKKFLLEDLKYYRERRIPKYLKYHKTGADLALSLPTLNPTDS